MKRFWCGDGADNLKDIIWDNIGDFGDERGGGGDGNGDGFGDGGGSRGDFGDFLDSALVLFPAVSFIFTKIDIWNLAFSYFSIFFEFRGSKAYVLEEKREKYRIYNYIHIYIPKRNTKTHSLTFSFYLLLFLMLSIQFF